MHQSQSPRRVEQRPRGVALLLGTLPKLQRIALDGNPLRSVRRDVIERGCEAVKAFSRTRAATPAEKTSEDDFDPLALANRVRDPVCGVFTSEWRWAFTSL